MIHPTNPIIPYNTAQMGASPVDARGDNNNVILGRVGATDQAAIFDALAVRAGCYDGPF